MFTFRAAPGVPLRDPVFEGELTQLHLNVQHQVELHLKHDPKGHP